MKQKSPVGNPAGEKEVNMSADKRDYAADLAVCEAATEGPWEVETQYMDEPGYEQYIKKQEIVAHTDEETLYVIARINWCNPVEANAQVMALARTALPWYIKRCMELENLAGLKQDMATALNAENARLRTRLAAAEAREAALTEALGSIKFVANFSCPKDCPGRVEENGECVVDDECSMGAILAIVRKYLSTPAPVNLEAMRRVVTAAKVFRAECRCLECPCVAEGCPGRNLDEALADLEKGDPQ
jgi:hypothetical protein